ncbi:protein held out wings-like isoform X1 [Panonychus citri]|uniref:protein held out wings-like isoform X1 n=1 Tax=Panonychus citri TaxID=50023 RepID=UPI002307B0E6|nr:protein held out wings-like isoform X1 [Panonychus citri]XP_053214105.1 protein held out wings-like isoform X1 [Panonychus citri]
MINASLTSVNNNLNNVNNNNNLDNVNNINSVNIVNNNNNNISSPTNTNLNTSVCSIGSPTSPSSTNSSCSPNSNNNVLIINGSNSADYLAQLLKDRIRLQAFPNVFVHIQRLVDNEIKRVRDSLFHMEGEEKKPLLLPDPEGQIVQQQEKVYVPAKEYPEYNFVGRILGPRGMTAKQLEQETGCKVMVRGRGSMRDKKKEEQNRGKPNWEHLNDELHVLITVEDTPNRAAIKMKRAVEEIRKLLIPVTEGEDELKKRQLMELAIINGTYRDGTVKNCIESEHMKLIAPPIALTTPIRTHHTATSLGTPLIFSPRHIHVPTSTTLLNGSTAPPPMLGPADAGFLYAPYDFHQYAALTSPLLAEYQVASQGDTTGPGKARRTPSVRDHPYQRPAT